jgi:hypothetical protein
MFARLQGKNLFKVGQTERIVYEKVAGLKRANILQSIMYNFSSEGAYSDSSAIFQLIGPTPDEIALEDVELISQNVRAQVLLDRLGWLSDCIGSGGCPKCSQKQNEGAENVVTPYIDSLSHKIWQDSRTGIAASHIRKALDLNPSFSKFVVFTHLPVMQLAESLLL